MKPLPLSGQAIKLDGVSDRKRRRLVYRLHGPSEINLLTDRDLVLVKSPEDARAASLHRSSSVLVVGDHELDFSPGILVQLPNQFQYLSSGDVIAVDNRSRWVRTLFRRSSSHNVFLVTERCNHFCLMCSQPPKDASDEWIIEEISESLALIDPQTPVLGFTGGEPLLDWRRFILLLRRVKEALPNTKVHVLTNGRSFARQEVVEAWSEILHPDLCAGIPIYSCVDTVHDHIVQSRGAFDETLEGVLRLANRGQRVEIRLVLHKLTIPGLVETAKWFARNLPFVHHIALMGLENTGFALANQEQLWIDPDDYRSELREAVDILSSNRMRVSIYNLPLCLIDECIKDFAIQSISDWKNAYLPACLGCVERDRCAGFFTTGRLRTSRGIKPIIRRSV